MSKFNVSIAGASGYSGGELLRLMLGHPHMEVKQVTSERNQGRPVTLLHPNLRRICELKFSSMAELEPCDVLFLCLPHGEAMKKISHFQKLSPRIIDLSADFRLKSSSDYETWYSLHHPFPDYLDRFVYGIPELHGPEMRDAALISSAGCNATAVILALFPLYKNDVVDPDRTVVEIKVGSSEGGASAGSASHHPERSGSIRAYKPTGHRHTAEMIQELGQGRPIPIHFSATSIDMVRGIHCVSHLFLKQDLEERDIWKLYRSVYDTAPFIRIVKQREGIYRLPEPKILIGSNYCDIGFVRDADSNRLVVYSALDNLMKGAAGQAVQALNLMLCLPETTGLEFPGLHPV